MIKTTKIKFFCWEDLTDFLKLVNKTICESNYEKLLNLDRIEIKTFYSTGITGALKFIQKIKN